MQRAVGTEPPYAPEASPDHLDDGARTVYALEAT